MKEFSPLEQLDIVLEFIAGTHLELTIGQIQSSINSKMSKSYSAIEAIVKRLVKDGYVQQTYINEIRNDYKITFDGYAFLYQGGYVKQAELAISESNRLAKLEKDQIEIQTNMQTLTFWIALGAIVAATYYLYCLIIPIYDHFFLKN